MQWSEVRTTYPNQWLVIKALAAHTTATQKRQLDQVAVIESCEDGTTAMQSYRKLHQHHPLHEYYFVHTSREELDIGVRKWLGVRTATGVAA
jgi:hypothetical protein